MRATMPRHAHQHAKRDTARRAAMQKPAKMRSSVTPRLIFHRCRRRSCARDRQRSTTAPAERSARSRASARTAPTPADGRSRRSAPAAPLRAIRVSAALSLSHRDLPPPSACCAIDVITSSRIRWKARSNSAPNSLELIISSERGRGRSTAMTSLMRPGRAVITMTSSPSRIASSIAWVTNRIGFVGLVENAQQFLLHHDLGLRVERGERLVHQQDRPFHDQRARQRHALAHAARQLARQMAARSRAARPKQSSASARS